MLSSLLKDHCRIDDDSDWSVMLIEILEQISDRLPLLDLVRFRSVCKQWRSSPSGRTELLNFSRDQPWLALFELEKNETGIPKCYIYTQSHPRCCMFKLHDLEGASVVASKFGWLLARRGKFFSLYNPFTFSRINLPELNVSGDCACTFTYLPTHRECTISVVNRMNDSSLNLSMHRVGDKEWNTQTISNVSSNHIGRRMRVSTCSHTHDDLCRDSCPSSKKKNTISIYNPEKDNKMRYRLLTKETMFVYGYSKIDSTTKYKLVRDEMISKHGKEWWQRSGGRSIDEIISKHEKEWWQRSGGRAISRRMKMTETGGGRNGDGETKLERSLLRSESMPVTRLTVDEDGDGDEMVEEEGEWLAVRVRVLDNRDAERMSD